jgi:DNA-binding beta-propeller fold protein YncE
MRRIIAGFCSLALIMALARLAVAQQNKTGGTKNNSTVATGTVVQRDAPLVFTEAIPLENAKGRFDHFAIGGGRLFVAALGSNAVEVINIGGRILDHAITGVPDPQGIAFSPEMNKIFVASGRGKPKRTKAASWLRPGEGCRPLFISPGAAGTISGDVLQKLGRIEATVSASPIPCGQKGKSRPKSKK